ncbi:hypothetical protein Lser_V15G43314 [Lactuca serriola]
MGDRDELHEEGRRFDICTKAGLETGISKSRSVVQKDEDYHRGVHVWIFAESTRELVNYFYKNVLDYGISLVQVMYLLEAHPLSLPERGLLKELGLNLPNDAFELLFVFQQECVTNGEKFINNEFNDVYLVTTLAPIPLEAFTLQESKVSAVKYISVQEYKHLLLKGDPQYVPYNFHGEYGQLFDIITKRLTGLTEEDKEVLVLIIQAARLMDDIFYNQLSSLDEDEAFLTTADSAVKLLPEATRKVAGWKGLEYKAAFPLEKPPGASFYPPDMDKMEFELWVKGLSDDEKKDATGFFSVIRRHSDSYSSNITVSSNPTTSDLYILPFSQEYSAFLAKAAELLHKAGDLTTSPSLKRLLHSKVEAFLSNDYYDSDIAWMELDSKLDVTIGPYETYEDVLFGYKAAFEAFIGIRDDKSTTQLKIFGDHLKVFDNQDLEQNLPMDDMYKSEDVTFAPIRIIQLVYNSGDVKGPQIQAYNLPNDERIVKDRGTSMVMLKNISEAKFKLILQPIADLCIVKEQRELVDFDSFFTHTICHECCHGIGPHTITLPSGQKSTVRLELQELHTALEEAKADIVGLWALNFLISKDIFPKTLVNKGQALQFNWLLEKGAYVLHPDDTFSVDFDKIEGAVEGLSREILTIQAKGDKDSAQKLLEKYGQMTQPLNTALGKLAIVEVPVDIAPNFPVVTKLLHNN